MAQDAYVTMLFSDAYLMGAQVLAASLRDGGTRKKLAVIVPSDEAHRLLPQTITDLKLSFDYVIQMPTLSTSNYANLRLLERPDLALTLTKINLWRLVQFRKCVYVDADVLALRAPDELFDLDVEFAAAPDVGWPDIFNSGVFVFKPSLATYYALKALADSGITFDGGDQGLLNTFFPTYHRLSFTYNVTPSTNYQYTPAYRYFSSNISLFHFIGRTKPWMQRSFVGGDSYNEATGRWWSVYERHFGWKIREDELKRSQEDALRRGRDPTPRFAEPPHPIYHVPSQTGSRPSTAERMEKHVSWGSNDTTFFHPTAPPPQMSSEPQPYYPPPTEYHQPQSQPQPQYEQPAAHYEQPPAHYEQPPAHYEVPAAHYEQPPPPRQPSPPRHDPYPRYESPPRHEPPPRQPSPVPFVPTMATWDPARSAPPADAGPEAQKLQIQTYESVWDKPYDPNERKWVPPPPSPLPKGYEYIPPPPPASIPEAPPPPPEIHDTSSESSMEEAERESSGYHTSDSESPEDKHEKPKGAAKERINPVFPWEMRGQRTAATRVFPGDEPAKSMVENKVVPPPRPYDRRASLDNYEFTNAWDSLPIIQSYVKQRTGEKPEPSPESANANNDAPTAPPVPKDFLAVSTATSASEGERWDPNKQLDKLKTGVISRLREVEKMTSPTNTSPTGRSRQGTTSSEDISTSLSEMGLDDDVSRVSALASITGLVWMSLGSVLTAGKVR